MQQASANGVPRASDMRIYMGFLVVLLIEAHSQL